MSSEEEKFSPPVLPNDSNRGSSVSSDLQEEYEELLRYTVVIPNIESSAAQSSHPKGEVGPDVRIPPVIDAILHNQGNDLVVAETGMEIGKACDANAPNHSKTEGLLPGSSPRKPTHPVMDFFSSHLLDDSSSPASNSVSNVADVQEVNGSDFLISDENLHKMENVLDLWSSDLKTSVISELSKWRLNFIDWHRMEMRKEKEKHAAHLKQLYTQINDLKELQKAYEVSIGRKDEVISSLSHAISKQKERIELMRTFFHWRIGHVNSRQDAYEGKLADQYFRRTLLKKTWKAWRSTIQRQWKEVVERACQARAEEVCLQISSDYENRMALLCGALENAKAEIQRMQLEKEQFEDSMKKAFMRGVCALNLEAMTIFQNRNETGMDGASNKREEYGPSVPAKEPSSHLDSSAPPMPAVVPPAPPPVGAAHHSTPQHTIAVGAGGMASTTAVPSGASMSSAGTASACSVHDPALITTFPGTAMPEERARTIASHLKALRAEAKGESQVNPFFVPKVVTSAQQKAGRTITARVTGRCEFSSKNRISSSMAIMGVSPPVSSVVVEKHHPVTVQTIPQATAAKYPRTIHPESSTSVSRPSGTRSAHTQSLASIHSIKVVD